MISINKKIAILSSFISVVIISLLIFNIVNYYSVDIQVNENSQYTESSNLISVYIEDEDGNYVLSETSNFDQGNNYEYNEEKSYCVNESVLSYNEETSKISVTASGTDNCYVYFDAKPLILLSEQILMNEENEDGNTFTTVDAATTYIESKDTPDFSTIADEDEGIFATEDNDGTSYYFRGATEDNYVEFAGMLWRIIRIDGQGNIKLMLYNNDVTGTNYQIEGMDLSIFSENPSGTGGGIVVDPGIVEESVLTEGEDGTVEEESETEVVENGNYNYSTIKKVVDNWYDTYIEIEYQKYLSKSKYCVDMRVSSSSGVSGIQYLNHTNLITNKLPSLECDLTLDNIYEYNYYVGIISAYELSFAGGVYGYSNLNYYLYTGFDYWALSLEYKDTAGGYYDVFYMSDTGRISSIFNSSEFYAMPTISLDSEVLFLEGNGTQSDPYKIIMD